MSRRLGLVSCALLSFIVTSPGQTAFAPEEAGTGAAGAADPEAEPGVPALFSWGDFNGDGRLDLAAVGGAGRLQLLINAGEGRFEDVTERLGLSDVENAALALWADYDGDGRLDLFVGAQEGASRLFHNEGEVFLDMSAGSGLASTGAVQSAQWLDYDGDGRLDLFVVTVQKNELFRGLEGGFFELADLPISGALEPTAPSVPGSSESGDGRAGRSVVGSGAAEISVPGAPLVPGSTPRGASATPLNPLLPSTILTPTPAGPFQPATLCAPTIVDTAGGPCLTASSTPALGKLYPISANLFVATGGNVGIGTTSPTAKLHVAGTARMTNTLTLNPSGDQALDVATGSIYKGGALFAHTRGGARNTALGREALQSVTSGSGNTASGYRALQLNTTGFLNTASGDRALLFNTTGFRNTATGGGALRSNTTGSNNTATGANALLSNTTGSLNTASGYNALYATTIGYQNTGCGHQALFSNTTGSFNTASGDRALGFNTTGDFNTASGAYALQFNTTGSNNTACGPFALRSNTTGNNNIAIGTNAGLSLTTGNSNIVIGSSGATGESSTIRIGAGQTRAFLAGVRGRTTGNANAIPVLIDSAGQLGTVSSSRRFKEEIRDMGELTERLLELRPVVFRYKPEVQAGERPLEYGLIAEEVVEIFPDLVVYDEEGEPFTVKYHLLSSMLLNELQEMNAELEELRESCEARLDALESRAAPASPRATTSPGTR